MDYSNGLEPVIEFRTHGRSAYRSIVQQDAPPQEKFSKTTPFGRRVPAGKHFHFRRLLDNVVKHW